MGRGKVKKDSEQDLFARVIGAWAAAGEDAKREVLGPRVLQNFNAVDAQRVRGMLSGGLPVELLPRKLWILGPPTPGEPTVHPLATISVWPDGVNLGASIRVALFGQGESPDLVHIQGWRFESPEIPQASQVSRGKNPKDNDPPPPKPRPFFHTQPILGWHRDGTCLEHAHEVPEDQSPCPDSSVDAAVQAWMRRTNCEIPGTPILAVDLPTLAIAFLVALYGAHRTCEILKPDDLLSRRIEQVQAYQDLLGQERPAS